MKAIRCPFSVCAYVLLAAGWLAWALLAGGCVTPGSTSSVVVRRYFAEWANRGDAAAADALLATNLVLRHPHTTLTGREAYKQSMVKFREAFPDLQFAIEDEVATGHRVLVRWTMTGTQRGEFNGQPASGKAVSVAGMSLFRLEGGHITEIWVNMDRLGFLQQLGQLPSPARP